MSQNGTDFDRVRLETRWASAIMRVAGQSYGADIRSVLWSPTALLPYASDVLADLDLGHVNSSLDGNDFETSPAKVSKHDR